MKKNLFLAALAIVALASCTDSEFVGDNSPDNTPTANENAIVFGLNLQNNTRAGELTGATAAKKLGDMFVVEGTKGSEQTNSPSTTVVFDNYLVGYTANTAATTESNTNNWEYVGLESGITSRMTGSTWTALHPEETGVAHAQTIKYWDYSAAQYDFIAWSTGTCEAVPAPAVAAAPSNGTIQVSRIATGSGLSSSGFTMRAARADDLLQCYYTDITTVKKGDDYGKPVTLTFKNMAAKVRVALYETVPGYSVKNVQFYTSDEHPTAPTDLNSDISANEANLFTMGGDVLPQSGTVTVLYPRIGTTYRDASPHPVDYNKASVTVSSVEGDATSKKQEFGTLTNQYSDKEAHEATGNIYLGRTLTAATFAGLAADSYYKAVVPNTNGKALTLRVNYTLVSTDGSGEEITIHGAKAVVPATYTKWLPNYAYTYIFKISDNTNGWTSQTNTDPKGLFPITFDAVVANFTDANAEQTTVTTVATSSITTYQQGHNHAAKDEYSKSQTVGASSAVKDLYVQVMDNSGATSTLKADLNDTGKSLLFKITKNAADYVASEAEVMDALQNRTNTPTGDPVASYKADSPVGRNGITLTKNDNIDNTVAEIVNGVDDQPITQIAGVDIAAGQVAKIDIDELETGTYAYVYSTTVPSSEKKVYNVVSDAEATDNPTSYYEVELAGTETPIDNASATAAADKLYFVKNVDAERHFVSYTFKQTKVGDNVNGLVEVAVPGTTATEHHNNSVGHYYFYFDVYYQNNGAYAVKVFKVVE